MIRLPIETMGDLPFQPGSPGGEMQCPVCRQHTPDAWQPLVYFPGEGPGHQSVLRVEPPEAELPPGAVPTLRFVSADFMFCANKACKELVVRLHENLNLPAHAVNDPEMLTRTWIARPRSASRPIDPLVPQGYRRDYTEAAAILDPSPRMSAVLSRRILGDLLKSYAGLTQNSLNAQVNDFIADPTQPRRLRENLHHLREMGDFGAHTQTNDADEVIDVSREEAEWTLDVIDGLFDHFIVGPERDKAMRAAFDEKLADAGRKAIPPLPDDEETT